MYNAVLVRTDIARRGIEIGIHIKATMPIAPGDEIYASYGRRGFKRAAPGFGTLSMYTSTSPVMANAQRERPPRRRTTGKEGCVIL